MKPIPQIAGAHVVTKLSTGAPVAHEIDDWHEPHGAIQSVAHIDAQRPGIIKQARLGASGLQLIRGDIAVCIPLEHLFALASEINPAFDADLNAPAPDLPSLMSSAVPPNSL